MSEAAAASGESITGRMIHILYGDDDATRLIECRRQVQRETSICIEALCHRERGYRAFRLDRIREVIDPETGEVLGDARWFAGFVVDRKVAGRPYFGLTRSRAGVLRAGLNVLAFIARCDGYWDPREHLPIVRFINEMWIKKDWSGEPPLDEILEYAAALDPDEDTLFASLKYFVSSEQSQNILLRAIEGVISADGIQHRSEFQWSLAIREHLDELTEAAFEGAIAADTMLVTIIADLSVGRDGEPVRRGEEQWSPRAKQRFGA
jgi:hypothetical protein